MNRAKATPPDAGRTEERQSNALWRKACALRSRIWGADVFLRGIVEFSSYCRQNCLYCGLRRDNTRLARYRMSAAAIVEAARAVQALGFGTVVLQSGEDPDFPADDLAGVIRRIKGELGLAVTLSVGERGPEHYRQWRKAGADRFLLKAETLDQALYARLRPGRTLGQRLESLAALHSLGYETGTGLIAGLPGESEGNMEAAITRLAAISPDMFSISPFTPHPATPLAACEPCGPESALRLMALARIAMPTAHIPVTSALGLYGDAVRLKALQVGNVLMPSLTPTDVREAYAIYPGKNAQCAEPAERARAMRDMLLEAGFHLPSGPGGAWRLKR